MFHKAQTLSVTINYVVILSPISTQKWVATKLFAFSKVPSGSRRLLGGYVCSVYHCIPGIIRFSQFHIRVHPTSHERYLQLPTVSGLIYANCNYRTGKNTQRTQTLNCNIKMILVEKSLSIRVNYSFSLRLLFRKFNERLTFQSGKDFSFTFCNEVDD